MIRSKVIQSQKVSIMHFSLQSWKITLVNVAYILKCNFKLILLGQLRKLRILYYDHSYFIILKQGKSTIRLVVRYKNVFILETGLKDKTMLIWERVRPTYLFSSKPRILLWHYCCSHASNVKIIKTFKLIDRINLRKISRSVDKPYLRL